MMVCLCAAQKVVSDIQSSMSIIERLQNFEYKDPNGKDWVSLDCPCLPTCIAPCPPVTCCR